MQRDRLADFARRGILAFAFPALTGCVPIPDDLDERTHSELACDAVSDFLGGWSLAALPNPSTLYCYEMYPDQQAAVLGTCRFKEKGIYTDPETNREWPDSAICEGQCAYGC